MTAPGELIGRLRLTAGLILFTYVTLHLANHALGLVSLSAMEAGRTWFLLLWRNPVVDDVRRLGTTKGDETPWPSASTTST